MGGAARTEDGGETEDLRVLNPWPMRFGLLGSAMEPLWDTPLPPWSGANH